MAETSWPSAGPTVITEHDHERLWSAYYQSGLVGDPSLSSLIFADSTGLQVKARAGRLAKVRGFEWSSGTTDVTVPITANASGSTRQDRVVLQLDRSTWDVRLHVVEGTPGAGRPALTQDPGPAGVWQLLAANLSVANGAVSIDAGDVDARNTYLGAPLLVADNGGLIDAPLPSHFLRYAPDDDELVFHTQGESTSGRRTLWQDSGEVAVSGVSTAWQQTVEGVIQKINNVVSLRYGSVQRIGSGSLPENVESTLPGIIPASMRHPTRDQYATVRISSHDAGRVIIHRANDPSLPGRIRIAEHPHISVGEFIVGFTLTWLVP